VVAHIFAWLLVFAVPWQDMVVLAGVGTMSKLLGVAAVGAAVLHVLFTGRLRQPIAFHWIVLAYLCWVLLSTFWAIAQPLSIERKVNTYLQILVMVWVIWETTPTRSRLASLLQAFVLGGYVAAGSTIYNYASGTATSDFGRFAAKGFDPNDLGMLLALALPMAWYLASTARSGTQRWLNRAYFVVGTLAILLTGSRGALLVTIAALSVIPWTLSQLRRGMRVAAVVILIGAGVTAVAFVPSFVFQRLSTTGSEIAEGTVSGRLAVWQSGLRVVPARPLHGYGPAGWFPAAGEVWGRVRGSHSTYLSILVEEGMIGLLLFLSMFVALLTRMRALPTFERRVGLTLLATLAIVITPLGWDTSKALWLILALLAGWSDVFRGARPVTSTSPPVRAVRRRPREPTPATVQ
jgi:O-antigen ligase